jgi:hypothetical protein
MKKWEDVTGQKEINDLPRVVQFVQEFQERFKNEAEGEELVDIACQAVALFLYGPAESEALALYAMSIKHRFQEFLKYKENLN